MTCQEIPPKPSGRYCPTGYSDLLRTSLPIAIAACVIITIIAVAVGSPELVLVLATVGLIGFYVIQAFLNILN